MTRTLPDPTRDRKVVERLIKFLSSGVRSTRKFEPDELPTMPLDTAKLEEAESANLPDPTFFPDNASLVLRVAGHKIVVGMLKQDVLLGRFSSETPTVDNVQRINLASYSGYRTGISRVHAMLRRTANNTVNLIDMDSVNGTFVNDVRLDPFKPHALQDGDVVRLAYLVIKVYFLVN
jgi:hypothetical protein